MTEIYGRDLRNWHRKLSARFFLLYRFLTFLFAVIKIRYCVSSSVRNKLILMWFLFSNLRMWKGFLLVIKINICEIYKKKKIDIGQLDLQVDRNCHHKFTLVRSWYLAPAKYALEELNIINNCSSMKRQNFKKIVRKCTSYIWRYRSTLYQYKYVTSQYSSNKYVSRISLIKTRCPVLK